MLPKHLLVVPLALLFILLVGCAGQVKEVYIEVPVYREIPQALFIQTDSEVPPTVDEMASLSSSKRLTHMTNYASKQTFFLGICRMQVDKLKGWNQEQRAVKVEK